MTFQLKTLLLQQGQLLSQKGSYAESAEYYRQLLQYEPQVLLPLSALPASAQALWANLCALTFFFFLCLFRFFLVSERRVIVPLCGHRETLWETRPIHARQDVARGGREGTLVKAPLHGLRGDFHGKSAGSRGLGGLAHYKRRHAYILFNPVRSSCTKGKKASELLPTRANPPPQALRAVCEEAAKESREELLREKLQKGVEVADKEDFERVQ